MILIGPFLAGMYIQENEKTFSFPVYENGKKVIVGQEARIGQHYLGGPTPPTALQVCQVWPTIGTTKLGVLLPIITGFNLSASIKEQVWLNG